MEQARVALFTLGCKVNRYESDAVAQQFVAAGYEVVDFTSPAEVMILNTCAVTGEAARKSGQILRRARKLNPQAVIAVMGCHVQLEGDTSVADIAVGTQGKNRIFEAVEHFRSAWAETGFDPGQRPPALDLTVPLDAKTAPDFEDFGSVDRQTETRAYMKIQDGCNNFCSYCAIPLARGRVRSRKRASILEEAGRIAQAGYREVVLTGIHVCSYGKEEGLPSTALTSLCREIARLEGIERIRLGSLEPLSVTDAFIQEAAANPKLCPHFHLSLQAGHDDTLARMRRRYRTGDYRHVVEGLRKAYGDRLGLTTDVIVGFPGETEEEFAATLAFCEEMGFTRMHIFRYSERAGTAALRLPNKVDPQTAQRRAMRLQHLASALQQKHFRRRLGQEDVLLLEQRDRQGRWTGYTPNYDAITLRSTEGFAGRSGLLLPIRLVEEEEEGLLAEQLDVRNGTIDRLNLT